MPAVALSPLAGAGWQFLDNSGAVLNGGLLYTYVAGTTTPVTTYQESTGTTPNANPIVLDAAGRVSTQVWLPTGASYKLLLRTSAGVLLWTMDNLRAVNDPASVPWSVITSKPTTVAGYGISDALTTTAAASTYAPIASPTFTGTAKAKDELTNTYDIGWRDVPQNSQTVSYQLVLADRGKQILMNGTSLTLTIPANGTVAFPIGTTIMVVNTNTTTLSIAITTDTMTLANSVTTGTRTLARNGVATITKIGTTSWLISGSGLT